LTGTTRSFEALEVGSPVAGRVIAMSDVPDPVFAGSMVGPGLAVDPDRAPGIAVSPVAGKLVKLHPHAFVVVAADGRGVLVHLGIDTVQLKGEGFELLVGEGDAVEAGTAVVRWYPGGVEAGGRSPICPVVALDAAADAVSDPGPPGRGLAAGDPLFTWT
jgi:sugar PTS system EIIA component